MIEQVIWITFLIHIMRSFALCIRVDDSNDHETHFHRSSSYREKKPWFRVMCHYHNAQAMSKATPIIVI